MGKEKIIKCGFCKATLDIKAIDTIKFGRKAIITCPHCNSILGIFA